jgi:hypothetical protein
MQRQQLALLSSFSFYTHCCLHSAVSILSTGAQSHKAADFLSPLAAAVGICSASDGVTTFYSPPPFSSPASHPPLQRVFKVCTQTAFIGEIAVFNPLANGRGILASTHRTLLKQAAKERLLNERLFEA